MPQSDELSKLAKKFSDNSRKSIAIGDKAFIPHKVKASGEIVDDSNFDASIDISKLNLADLRFLDAWKEAGWSMEKACEKMGIEIAKAKRMYEKVRYFEFEDQKIKTLAKVPTPDFVTAKNLEGFYQNNLSDAQRDHLKELAKITGAYKPTTNVNINAHVLQMPQMSPEQAKAAKDFFDTLAIEEKNVA